MMKTIKGFIGKSQFDEDIEAKFRASACGPVTAFVILRHLSEAEPHLSINKLYRSLGGTKIGLSKYRMIRNLRKLLGAGWNIESCGIEDVLLEIDEGRPVAAKFDKWFTFHWLGKFTFDYHWVPIVGYEKHGNDLILLIHDNGGRNRTSQLRKVSYEQNKKILSFVKMKKTAAF